MIPEDSSQVDQGRYDETLGAEMTQAIDADGAPIPGRRRREAEALPASIGRFAIIRELGRGGFGVVYLAHDPLLGRVVALKVPLPGMLDSAGGRARFMREARAAAGLDHPNIVPVYEAGELGPVAYIASTYCEGPSLSDWLKARVDPVPAKAAATLVAALAQAVQHAHDRGILHLDLKPGNVMLQGATEPGPADSVLAWLLPRVTDFGLARLTGDDGDDSRSGLTVGSPPYMAPEQVAGPRRDLGPATDVYALGATLYEVLVGRPPFRGWSQVETLRQVIEDDPVPPRDLRPDLPRDLQTICLHCLNKNAARRYPTAAELAEDLDRFLQGRPIRSRPASAAERALKWSRRRPAMAALLALATLAGSGLGGGMAWYNARLRDHNERLSQAVDRADRHASEAERLRRIAERREEVAGLFLHGTELVLARQACDEGQFERAQEILSGTLGGPGPDRRDFAWWHLWRLSRREVALIGHLASPSRLFTLSADGRTLATTDASGRVTLRDLTSDRPELVLPGHSGPIYALAFAPDGRTLASAGPLSTLPDGAIGVLVREVATGRITARPEGSTADPVSDLAFLDGGRVLVLATQAAEGTSTARGWVLAGGDPAPRLRYEVGGLGPVAPSPDGRFLAARSAGGSLVLLDPATGRTTRVVAPDASEAADLAVSPDGRLLAATAPPTQVLVWDLEAGGPPRSFDEAVRPTRLVFGPGGATLLTDSGGVQVTLRDLGTGQTRAILPTNPARRGTLQFAFSPDGRKLAMTGEFHPGGIQPVTLWDVATGVREAVCPGRKGFVSLAFTPDGSQVLLGGDRDLTSWRPGPPAEPPVERFRDHDAEVWAVAFAPDGRTVASGGDDEKLRLWDPATARQHDEAGGHAATVSALAYRPDGRVLATASFEGRDNIKLRHPATGRAFATLSGHTDRVRALAFSPDGTLLASTGSDRTVRLWDGETGAPIAILGRHDDAARALAFSPDGRTLASAGNDGTVRLWDPRRRRPIATLEVAHQASGVAFAPDGQTLASADEGGFISFWDAADGAFLRAIHADEQEIRALAYSPDGRTLASAGMSRAVRLWDAITGQGLLTLAGAAGQVNALAFAPDGATLAAADHAGAVILFRGHAEDGPSLPFPSLRGANRRAAAPEPPVR